MGSNSFVEIEHKFVVPANFNRDAFLKKVSDLSPNRQARAKVRDTYFVLAHDNQHVYRHRFDNEIQQLTVKSIEHDAAVRTEINIPIDQSKGDQRPAILEFMNTLGCRWSGDLAKEIHVAYFHDCEIVFYRAVNQGKEVYCIEFEAVNPGSIEEGLNVLKKYEVALGFVANDRESKSLFELLLLDTAPDKIKAMFC